MIFYIKRSVLFYKVEPSKLKKARGSGEGGSRGQMRLFSSGAACPGCLAAGEHGGRDSECLSVSWVTPSLAARSSACREAMAEDSELDCEWHWCCVFTVTCAFDAGISGNLRLGTPRGR